MRTMKVLSIGLFLALIGIISGLVQDVRDAQAIPAFARKYDFTCNVCHVPGFPKLNDFGNIFRDQGYQFGADNDLPTFEALGKGFWPVSFRTTAGYELASQRVDGGDVTTGGVWSAALDVLSFGTLARNISFGIVLTGATATPGSGGSIDLESAFARVLNLERFLGGSSNTYLMNLKVGKFELDLPFSEKRSPTLNDAFVMYHYIAGTPWIQTTLAGLNVTSAGVTANYLNPNQFAFGANQPGIELTGITKTDMTGGYFRYSLAGLTNNFNTCSGPTATNPATGLPNTAGTPFSGGASPGNSLGNCTGNGGHNFNFYGHVTQSFGGYGIVSGQRVGAFFMYGQAPTLDNPVCPACQGTQGNSKDFTRVGADASLTYGQFNLFGAYMYALDSAGLFASTQTAPVNANGTNGVFQNAVWNGGFAELDWYPNQIPVLGSGYLFGYRYDLIQNVRQGISSFSNNYNNVDSHTFLVRDYIHQSSRTDFVLHAEVNFYRDKGVGVNGGDLKGQSMLIGFDWAF
jgi:hypothetical protein